MGNKIAVRKGLLFKQGSDYRLYVCRAHDNKVLSSVGASRELSMLEIVNLAEKVTQNVSDKLGILI